MDNQQQNNKTYRGRYFLRLLDYVVVLGREEAEKEGLTLSSYIEKLILTDIGRKKGDEGLECENLELEQCSQGNAGRQGEASGGNGKNPET